MTTFCLINLYGPMAGYGGIACGDMRPSWPKPSRSAVLGMIGAALGVRRDEEELQNRMQKAYGFSVMVLQPGIIMQDFHTIQTHESSVLKKQSHVYTRKDEMDLGDSYTVLSRREYLCDQIAVGCIWIRDEETAPFSLEKIQNAFFKPVFYLYLGRKSCPPALPVHARLVEKESLKQAFFEDIIQFDALQGFRLPKEVSVYWEDGIDTGFTEPSMCIRRRDNILSRTRWQFSERNEYYARVKIPEVS